MRWSRLLTKKTARPLLAPDQSEKEVDRAFSREMKIGSITQHHFVGREHYYIQSLEYCRTHSLPEERAEPLGPTALLSHYSFLLYSLDRGVERLMREELQNDERFKPLLGYSLDSTRYVLTDEGLTLMVADCGPSSINHLTRKIRHEWTKRKKASDAWRELIGAGGFSIAAIVASEEKARRLRKFLKLDGEGSIRAHVACYPELTKLITELITERD